MNQNADLIMNTNQWPVLLDHFRTGIVPISNDSKAEIECLIFGTSGIESAPTNTRELATVMYSNPPSLENIAEIIEECGYTIHEQQIVYLRIFAYMLDFDMSDVDSISPEAKAQITKWNNITSKW